MGLGEQSCPLVTLDESDARSHQIKKSQSDPLDKRTERKVSAALRRCQEREPAKNARRDLHIIESHKRQHALICQGTSALKTLVTTRSMPWIPVNGGSTFSGRRWHAFIAIGRALLSFVACSVLAYESAINRVNYQSSQQSIESTINRANNQSSQQSIEPTINRANKQSSQETIESITNRVKKRSSPSPIESTNNRVDAPSSQQTIESTNI